MGTTAAGVALFVTLLTQPLVSYASPPINLAFPRPYGKPVLAGPKKTDPPPPKAPPAADVETAELLAGKLEYDEANKVAERVVAKHGLSHEQLLRAYKVFAVTHAVLDHEDAAREAFILLLTYDPEYTVDTNLGPKVSAPFYEARGYWRAQTVKPGIEVAASLRAQETGTLRVTTRDPTHIVKKVNVGIRWDSKGDFTISTVSAGDGSQVEVPTSPVGHTRLDYYAQALDDRDDVVIELGNPSLPKTALADPAGTGKPKAEEKGGKSIFGSPIFWTVAGVLVAGGATAGFFLLQPKDPTSATLTSGAQCGPGAPGTPGTRCN